jgi:small subunit ribosomal protein S21
MIIINIKNGDNLERALKTLKSKVIKTKQNQKLNERKEYTKKSVVRRAQILKAKYIQSKNMKQTENGNRKEVRAPSSGSSGS